MMKAMLMILLMGSSMQLAAQQLDDLKAVKKVVFDFAKAGDEQDIKQLENVLHPNYQVNMNQLFGSKELAVWSRDQYLQMMKDKKIGGDERVVEIAQIDIQGNNAVVKAYLLGTKLKFQSYFSLVKNVDGNWQLLSDLPTIME